MTQTTVGSCLCATVKYEISGAFERFFLCHCTRCRKGTGSAHAANLFASNATLNWISGRDSIQAYRVPGTRHGRSFCMKCGSAVPTAYGTLIVVPAGSVDSPIDVRPNAHICVSSRADWDNHLEDIPKVDALPG